MRTVLFSKIYIPLLTSDSSIRNFNGLAPALLVLSLLLTLLGLRPDDPERDPRP